MKKKSIVFIESNTSGTGKIFLEISLSLGYTPIVLSTDFDKYSFYSEVATWVKIENHSPHEISGKISLLERNYEISAITSTSDFYIQVASAMAIFKNLKSANLAILELCRNKHLLREKMRDHGFNTPWFISISRTDDLKKIAPQIKYPVVVKPVSGSGSSQVTLCSDFGELYSNASAILINNKSPINDHRVLIEQYIEGNEYSAEIFNGNIIGLTKKHLGKLPSFVEIGHDFPFTPGITLSQDIEKSLVTIINTMGLTFGPYHIEFRISNNEFWLIEINPRLAGGYIPTIVKNAVGVDLIKATLKNLVSKGPNTRATVKKYSSIRFIVPNRIGKITKIMLPTINLDYSYSIYSILPNVVENISHDFKDRIGHIITVANSFSESELGADKIISLVEIIFNDQEL